MKKLILSIVAFAALSINTFGQAPEGFNYQAVVRNTSNTIVTNQTVGMRIEILQGGISGAPVYTESFAPTTNNYGLVNLEIGTGSTLDNFSSIDWANDIFFIRTSFDVTGGSTYAVMGTSQLMSVPYALHSKTAESAVNDQVNDADADPINEIQDLSLSGNMLTITNNGAATMIDLSMYLDNTDTQLTEAEVDAYVANNGYLTAEVDSSTTNELITSMSLSGTTLTVNESSNTQTVNLSSLIVPKDYAYFQISGFGKVQGENIDLNPTGYNTNMAFDFTSDYVVLKAGKTYILEGTAWFINMTSPDSRFGMCFYDQTNNLEYWAANSGTRSFVYSVLASTTVGAGIASSQPNFSMIVTPVTDIHVGIKLIEAIGTCDITALADHIIIREL